MLLCDKWEMLKIKLTPCQYCELVSLSEANINALSEQIKDWEDELNYYHHHPEKDVKDIIYDIKYDLKLWIDILKQLKEAEYEKDSIN